MVAIEIKISAETRAEIRKNIRSAIMSGPMVRKLNRMSQNSLQREIDGTGERLKRIAKNTNGSNSN